ncbi:hypothetical protein [Stecheria intestinalis]|uniref:hypothetical protein n=1 Tax=Stecheria intestinalis TaxID=2606630 RepID=UPI0023F197F3|nr:hypothetical protein [Stecheria intestinalis]MDD5881348.1 hypothetical protein [Stecheria intestinalis]
MKVQKKLLLITAPCLLTVGCASSGSNSQAVSPTSQTTASSMENTEVASASSDTGALQYYIDAAVTEKNGEELTVLVEDKPMKLNLSEVENLYPSEIQAGDTIRVSTSAESLDTFAVIENAERITAPE